MTLVKDPNQTERIFDMSASLRKRLKGQVPPAMQAIFKREDFQSVYANRYNPKIDLEVLRKLPANTFGGSVARFLDLNGFEANTFPMIGEDTEMAYLISRIRQTHDLWHVLTGYGTGVQSELALQGFMMSQLGLALPAMIIAGGILHTVLMKPMEVLPTFEMIVEGYQRGKMAKSLSWVKALQQNRGNKGFTLRLVY